MKKGLVLAVLLAVGCSSPPVGIDGTGAAEVSPAMAKRSGEKLGGRHGQQLPDATICTADQETGEVECSVSPPMSFEGPTDGIAVQ